MGHKLSLAFKIAFCHGDPNPSGTSWKNSFTTPLPVDISQHWWDKHIIKFHPDGQCWDTRINGIYIKATLPADKLHPWPVLVSVHCTESLKTAEIQPCYSFSPEAPSQLQSSLLEPRSNERKQCSFGSVDRKLVFHFWNAQASIPLFLWDNLSTKSTFCCCSEALSRAPFLVFLQPEQLGYVGGSSTEKWNLVALLWPSPFTTVFEEGDLFFLLGISDIPGRLVSCPSWGWLSLGISSGTIRTRCQTMSNLPGWSKLWT